MNEQELRLSPLQAWILAIRPKTLPAALSPVIVGAAAAAHDGGFRPGPALAALLAALLLQIGANLANDVFDFHKGADTQERLGPTRVTQAGLLRPEQVMAGMWLTFGLAALLGLYLILVAGWPVLVIGLASIAAAIAYTGGPFPLGYNGLGDLFVFLFFGPAAVAGTYYVQVERLAPLAIWSAVPMGLLTTAILVVNNLRDIETDRAAGKRTLAVRLGRRGTQNEYLLLLGGAYLAPLLTAVFRVVSPWVLLSWLSIPPALLLIRLILNEKGRPLNKALAGTGQLELAYGALYSLGLLVAAL